MSTVATSRLSSPQRLLGGAHSPYEHSTIDYVKTDNPNIICGELPRHWRSNKALPRKFKIRSHLDIPDGTVVTLTAGNKDYPNCELKNARSYFYHQEAIFNDLRFIGRSGRGQYFDVVLKIHTEPKQVATYRKAIKITVDGPRQPRAKHKAQSNAFGIRPAKQQQLDSPICATLTNVGLINSGIPISMSPSSIPMDCASSPGSKNSLLVCNDHALGAATHMPDIPSVQPGMLPLAPVMIQENATPNLPFPALRHNQQPYVIANICQYLAQYMAQSALKGLPIALNELALARLPLLPQCFQHEDRTLTATRIANRHGLGDKGPASGPPRPPVIRRVDSAAS